MRRLVLALGLATLVGAVYLVLGAGQRGEGARWVTARVDRGPVTATVTATGTLSPVTSVQVGTYVSGPIAALYADFNTPVRQGQLLARIDPRPFQVKVDGAVAALANARAQLEKAKADAALKAVTLRRTQDLAREGIVSADELDRAASEDRQARAQVDLDRAAVGSAEAGLREAEVNLAYTDITSPVEGVVVSRNVDVGQTVAASFQTPTLFLVAGDLTAMQVTTSVSESDIGAVAPGQAVTFAVDAHPGRRFEGRVEQVRNAAVTVQNVVTYEVVVRVANPALLLKPGMTANVTIVTAERPDTLRVQTSALRFRPPVTDDGTGAAVASGAETASGPQVWVPDGAGRPQRVAVTTGIRDERHTEITAGLAEGQEVIVAMRRELPAAPAGSPPFLPPRGQGRR